MATRAKRTTKKGSQKSMSATTKVALGVGLTAATAAAVGGYFLYGSKQAKQNRKKVKSWMLKAKADVLEGIENVKNITEEEYHELVDAATKAYAKTRKVSKSEMAEFSREMKDHWKDIQKSGAVRKVTKRTKKKSTKKKSAKKATKKSAPRKKTKKAPKRR